MQIAILDDYQSVALELADWSVLAGRADIKVFSDHVADVDILVARLQPYEVICVMRERTPLPRSVLRRLPRLRLIASTGPHNDSIDTIAAAELGISVVHTRYTSTAAIEYTWALILASARHVVDEAVSLRAGRWQHTLGIELRGKSLALLGLGSIGREVARIGRAFGMQVIAWSSNLTAERAAAAGAELVSKEELFERADILSIHLVLSDRTRGLVDAALLGRMKPSARLVNTSRGPIVDEGALLEALRKQVIAGAAVDVFETEPLPVDHPLRAQDRLLATPHFAYVSEDLYRIFYGDTVVNISNWLDRALA